MPRDLFAEYDIDPNSIKNGSSNGAPISSSPANSSISPPRDLFAEYGINSQEANQSSWMPTHSVRDILGGIATAGQNVNNAFYDLASGVQKVHNMVTPESMNTNFDFDTAKTNYNFNAPGSIGLGVDYPTQGDKFAQGVGQYAPAALLPEAPLVGKALGGEGIAARYLPNMVSQGAYGASQSPDDRLSGLGVGAAGGAFGQAAGDILNALRPSQLFRGGLSPEQLQANVEATRGTNTPLGEVIASPTLNRLQENILPHIMFSGSEKTSQDTANQVIGQGNQIMQQLGSGLPQGNFGAQLQDALKATSAQARSDKNAMYGKVNDLADEHGLVVGRDNLRAAAQSALGSINSSFELKPTVDSGLVSTLKNISNNPNEKQFLSKESLSVKTPDVDTLKKSNVFKGKLNDMANNYYSDGKMYEYGIMKSLKDALGADINDSITNSGSDELKNAYQDAQQNYATNFAPFDDKDVVKFTRQGGDSDLILNHFLKGGANDRANLLAKLQNAISSSSTNDSKIALSQDTQLSPENLSGMLREKQGVSNQGITKSNLLPYAYLSRSMNENGQVNPVELAKLYNELGTNQKNILIKDPEMRSMLDNYTNLVGKNKEAFNLMFNPKTGARNTGPLQFLEKMLVGGAAGYFAGIPAAIGSQLVASGGAKIANKLLTSPSFRESLVNQMIKNKKYELPQSGKSGLAAALQMYGNSNSVQ